MTVYNLQTDDLLCELIYINLITIPFSELVESVDRGEISREALDEMLNSFSCKREPFIENFIRKSIYTTEAMRSSRSFFILDEDKDFLCPLGFYSLSLKVFYICDDISKTTRGKLGLKDDQKHTSTYYIAILAKNDSYNEQIEGKLILESAMGKIIDAIKHVGGRITWVEAKKNKQKVVDFYTKNGFKEFQTELQEDDEYSHLLKVIKPE